MRILAFSRNGTVQYGVRNGDQIRIYPTANSAVDLAVDVAAHPAGDSVALSDVTLLAPVQRPGKLICIGLNYRAHALEGGNPIVLFNFLKDLGLAGACWMFAARFARDPAIIG